MRLSPLRNIVAILDHFCAEAHIIDGLFCKVFKCEVTQQVAGRLKPFRMQGWKYPTYVRYRTEMRRVVCLLVPWVRVLRGIRTKCMLRKTGGDEDASYLLDSHGCLDRTDRRSRCHTSIEAGRTLRARSCRSGQCTLNLLLIIGIILLVLWFLWLVSSYTLGGYVYLALVIGLILVAISLVPRFRRRRQIEKLSMSLSGGSLFFAVGLRGDSAPRCGKKAPLSGRIRSRLRTNGRVS